MRESLKEKLLDLRKQDLFKIVDEEQGVWASVESMVPYLKVRNIINDLEKEIQELKDTRYEMTCYAEKLERVIEDNVGSIDEALENL